MTLKIDAFSHFAPARAVQEFERVSGHPHPSSKLYASKRLLSDVRRRLEFMDEHEVIASILVPLPWIESEPSIYADPSKAAWCASVMNDEMAAAVANSEGRVRAVALLPTANAEIATAEFTRAVMELGAVGGMITVGPSVKRVDHRDYEALFRLAEELDAPLWWHPSRPISCPDYDGARSSEHSLWQTLGWLKDTSDAMTHFVFSDGFVRHPRVKIITHHHGAFIPLFAQRIQQGFDIAEHNGETRLSGTLSRPYIEHFKKFYCDTATSGLEPRLLDMAVDFFGPGHVVFGSDTPMDSKEGVFIRATAESVEQMTISEDKKKKIFFENILCLLKSVTADLKTR